jgi:DNA-binding transcriptional regulator PaaX
MLIVYSHRDILSSMKAQNTKKILKKLAEKPVVPIEIFKENIDPKASYALTRAIKNLVEAGYADVYESAHQKYLKITPKGKTKLDTLKIEAEDALVPLSWDGLWRIIILDIPEERKNERESLRYLLKKANFVCIKNTVWISPYPYENIFTNIKKDLGFTTELMILVTDKLDPETSRAFLEAIKK